MIDPPPRRRIAGTAAFIPSHTPFWLTLTTASHSSSLVSSRPFIFAMPALFTRTSNPPNSLSHVSTAARQSAARVTSRWTARTILAPCLALIATAVCPVNSSRKSPITTLAPSAANSFASAAPCPRAPPEISATLPFSRSILHLALKVLRQNSRALFRFVHYLTLLPPLRCAFSKSNSNRASPSNYPA